MTRWPQSGPTREPDDPAATARLRHTLAADCHGPNRFARCQAFFATAQSEARHLGVPLAWRLEVVPGVGHDNAGMAVAAAARFIGDERR